MNGCQGEISKKTSMFDGMIQLQSCISPFSHLLCNTKKENKTPPAGQSRDEVKIERVWEPFQHFSLGFSNPKNEKKL